MKSKQLFVSVTLTAILLLSGFHFDGFGLTITSAKAQGSSFWNGAGSTIIGTIISSLTGGTGDAVVGKAPQNVGQQDCGYKIWSVYKIVTKYDEQNNPYEVEEFSRQITSYCGNAPTGYGGNEIIRLYRHEPNMKFTNVECVSYSLSICNPKFLTCGDQGVSCH